MKPSDHYELSMEIYLGLQNTRNTPLPYNVRQEDGSLSATPLSARRAESTRHVNSSALPNLKRRYIPSLYDNQDQQLARKVKEFLKKPPFNSQEYFEMLWIRRQSEHFSENKEVSVRAIKSAPTSADELSRKLRHLRPEKRPIQSMILPPIRDGCTKNYHDKYSSKTAPLVDPSLNLIDQLKYCRYIRHKPVRHQAWENRGQENKMSLFEAF